MSYKLKQSVDYRLQWQRTQEGFLLTNTAGTVVVDNEIASLNAIHGELITEFSNTITDQAKRVWQIAG